MPDRRLLGLVAFIVVLLFGAVLGSSHRSEQAPRVNSQNRPQNAGKAEQNATGKQEHAARSSSVVPGVLPPSPKGEGQSKAENAGEEGTEFWPTFLGLRLKITDTILALFTAGLFFATYALWLATRNLVRGADKTAERQLRPYVSLKPFQHSNDYNETSGKIRNWYFRCVWHNLGQTPTKYMTTRVGLLRKDPWRSRHSRR